MRNFQEPLYKKWRQEVYSRDNYRCQWPGCESKLKLNAHHIKKWSEYPGLRYLTANGITLCKKHHDMIKNMESDYELFFMKLVLGKNVNK